ncbi:MAG: iron-sulfur cluster repair protein YtfE [Planctomycetota bacterium]
MSTASEASRPVPSEDSTLAELATHWAGASRVFQRHDLDFCCAGGRSLREACRERRLDVRRVLEELRCELTPEPAERDWQQRSLMQLIAHLVDHFHEGHRRELPRLCEMAAKVERVHGDKPECPRGLAAHLGGLAERLEAHMQKEEQVLFPLVLRGIGREAAMPIRCMEQEHDEAGVDLRRTRALVSDFVPPQSACTTWRALYVGLAEFERGLMEHVHLENHVLFPRILSD